MTTTTRRAQRKQMLYHPQAYHFVFQALRYTQDTIVKFEDSTDEESMHISGQQLLEGIKELALRQFGLMTIPVFAEWGVHATDDFGKIVFELIEQGEMRKTDRDQLTDFFNVYQFDNVFNSNYAFDLSEVFGKKVS